VIRKVEVLANIAVVITSVILCSVLVNKYFFTSAKPEAPVKVVQFKVARCERVTKVVDSSRSIRTVVLALSTTCHFCSESAPFYQKLQQQKPNNVRLVAVFSQPVGDSRNYLNRLGVSVSDVVQGSLSSVGVSGTPTLLLIDNQGSITDSWVGRLSDSEAARVIEQIHQ
jgi:thiol-disulfide isomerase/thioredoxin